MALYAISQGGLVNALDTQQIINLLTGVMQDQAITLARPTGSQMIIFNGVGAAGGGAYLLFQRGGTQKFAIGTDASDHLAFFSSTLGVNGSVSDTGDWTLAGKLLIGNRPAFVTGDKYLVVDASGNVHVSSLGPAS